MSEQHYQHCPRCKGRRKALRHQQRCIEFLKAARYNEWLRHEEERSRSQDEQARLISMIAELRQNCQCWWCRLRRRVYA